MTRPVIFTISAAWDQEASVWSGHCDDIPAAAEAAHLIGGLDVDRAQRANFERKVGESSKIISEVRLLPRSPPPKNKNSRVFRPGHPEL